MNLRGSSTGQVLGLPPQWSRVRVLSGSLETYMIVNFRVRRISRGARKLARTPTLIKKNYRDCFSQKVVVKSETKISNYKQAQVNKWNPNRELQAEECHSNYLNL